MTNFLAQSSVHGLKYLSKDETGIVARLIWFLVITMSFASAIGIVYINVSSWEDSPTVIASLDFVGAEVSTRKSQNCHLL